MNPDGSIYQIERDAIQGLIDKGVIQKQPPISSIFERNRADMREQMRLQKQQIEAEKAKAGR